MLLTRSLPPPFLLPAWSSGQLAQLVQRAQKSDVTYTHKQLETGVGTLPEGNDTVSQASNSSSRIHPTRRSTLRRVRIAQQPRIRHTAPLRIRNCWPSGSDTQGQLNISTRERDYAEPFDTNSRAPSTSSRIEQVREESKSVQPRIKLTTQDEPLIRRKTTDISGTSLFRAKRSIRDVVKNKWERREKAGVESERAQSKIELQPPAAPQIRKIKLKTQQQPLKNTQLDTGTADRDNAESLEQRQPYEPRLETVEGERIIAEPQRQLHEPTLGTMKLERRIVKPPEQSQEVKLDTLESRRGVSELLKQPDEPQVEYVDDKTIARVIRKLLDIPNPSRPKQVDVLQAPIAKPLGFQQIDKLREANTTNPKTLKSPKEPKSLFEELFPQEGEIQKRSLKGASTENPKTLKPPKKPKSLFEELFPEEGEIQRRSPKEAEELLERLPAFQWADPNVKVAEKRGADKLGFLKHIPKKIVHSVMQNDETTRWSESKGHYLAHEGESQQEAAQQAVAQPKKLWKNLNKLTKTVVALKACSKTLEESDFFRVSPRGEHVEGWTRGILKVIPIRENNTLEPLGDYFILFDSDASALAYTDQLHRLFRLAKGHTKMFPGLPIPKESGEDVESLVKNFTLVPGYTRLFIKNVNKPYTPEMLKLLDNGDGAQIATRKSNAKDMVLLTLDDRHLTQYDLLEAIKYDGQVRNLHWGLAGGLNGRSDSITKLSYTEVDRATDGVREMIDSRVQATLNAMLPRFLIAFKDRDEARRFVREWHCRPLPVRTDRNQHQPRPEDPPPALVNAKILW